MWAALLIVFGALLLVSLVLGSSRLRAIKKGTPPVPEQAVAEAKLTTEAIKANGRTNTRTTEDVRRDIAAEREQLADAVEDLRAGIGEATDVSARLRERLPVVAAGALATGFVVAGGIGATMRFVARRGRDGRERVKLGRFSLVDKS